MKRFAALLLFTAMCAAGSGPFQPPSTRGVGIDQKLNAAVPLDTTFVDESGATVPLRKFFHGKPVLLAPVYYECPMLCSQILSGVVAALRPLSLKPGRDFEIVAISFDPRDTPQIARDKRDHYAHSYSSSGGVEGWHFLTGTQPSIHAVMNAIGFRYRWDAAEKIFVHASGVMLITPEGRVGRYLYGVDYEPKDMKLGLIEASHEQIGSPVDQVLLFCYHYDPKTGKYGAAVINLMRGAAVLTLLVLGGGMALFWKHDVRTYHDEGMPRS
jgi:protein SCO1/2